MAVALVDYGELVRKGSAASQKGVAGAKEVPRRVAPGKSVETGSVRQKSDAPNGISIGQSMAGARTDCPCHADIARRTEGVARFARLDEKESLNRR